jgi:hypothetical protein
MKNKMIDYAHHWLTKKGEKVFFSAFFWLTVGTRYLYISLEVLKLM